MPALAPAKAPATVFFEGAAPASDKRRDRPSLSVLVVDDDPDDVELILGVLRPHLGVADYVVAPDGEQALEVLEHTEYVPDLIILDLNMPRLGGHDVLRRVRRLDKSALTPVVILTTSGRMSDVCEAQGRAANRYIVKPDSSKELQSRLDAVINAVLRGAMTTPGPGGNPAAFRGP
jgi:CheY-like chemotaxis protein